MPKESVGLLEACHLGVGHQRYLSFLWIGDPLKDAVLIEPRTLEDWVSRHLRPSVR